MACCQEEERALSHGSGCGTAPRPPDGNLRPPATSHPVALDALYLLCVVGAKSAPLRTPWRASVALLPCSSSPTHTRFAGLWVGPPQAVVSGLRRSSKQSPHRSGRPGGHPLLCSLAPPLQPTPALLGCGLVLRRPLFPACAGHPSKVRTAPDALAGIRCSAPLLLSGPFPLSRARAGSLLKQSRDPAVLVYVDLLRRRDLGQAGHGSPRDHSPAGAPSFVSSGGQSPPCGNSSLRSEFTAHARRGATAPT